MRVLLVRHGETDWNAAGKIQGVSDIALNGRGREQARSLAEALAAEGVAEIYTSPLRRALETAQIIGGALGLVPREAPELMELNFGCWEGCSWEEIAERWPDQFAAYAADRNGYAAPGGESYDDMLARARPFTEALRRKKSAGSALCVCHSAVMRGLIAAESGFSVDESYRRLRLPNGVVRELESR